MTIYEAIHKMRELTRKRQPFAIGYMTYSLQRGMSHGEECCEHALLIKNPKSDDDDDAHNFMLTYRDQDTGEVRRFWQPLLMSLNHEPLTSID